MRRASERDAENASVGASKNAASGTLRRGSVARLMEFPEMLRDEISPPSVLYGVINNQFIIDLIASKKVVHGCIRVRCKRR